MNDIFIDDLYREVIIDHYKNPRYTTPIDNPTVVEEGVNPLCGDHIKLSLRIIDNAIEAVSCSSKACSICTASASMMTELIQHQPLDRVDNYIADFKSWMTADTPASGDVVPGDLESLGGVRKFPVRIKCALLPWNTLQLAINTVKK